MIWQDQRDAHESVFQNNVRCHDAGNLGSHVCAPLFSLGMIGVHDEGVETLWPFISCWEYRVVPIIIAENRLGDLGPPIPTGGKDDAVRSHRVNLMTQAGLAEISLDAERQRRAISLRVADLRQVGPADMRGTRRQR